VESKLATEIPISVKPSIERGSGLISLKKPPAIIGSPSGLGMEKNNDHQKKETNKAPVPEI
jgi:hypothetical protein